jgi:hypothetical protein
MTDSSENSDDDIPDQSLFGEGPYSTLNKKVEIRDHQISIIKKGLFAKEKIFKNEIVW